MEESSHDTPQSSTKTLAQSQQESKNQSSLLHIFLPILFCGLSIPLSMFMWIGNLAFSKFYSSSEFGESNTISPTRWLFSILCPLVLMLYAVSRKAVDKSGASLGLIFAIILSISNHAFFACLAAFFFTSSRATRFRAHLKLAIDKGYKGGEGRRNWLQVLCNGGMATQLAILYLIDCGSGEKPINFQDHYRSSWLSIAIMSSFACCNGDTWASELGTVISDADPYLVTTRRKVPRGTNGGVSIPGLVVSFLGGIMIGIVYFLTIIHTCESKLLLSSPEQWPVIFVGGFAGFFGSLIDSILGATLQYSGVDQKDGKIVGSPGLNVKHISGMQILDNHSVNLISSIITGVTVPALAILIWPED